MKIFPVKEHILIVLFFLLITDLYSQSFTEQTNIILPGISNGSASWGDYDNDGDLDILITGVGDNLIMTIKVFRNNGSNSFIEQSSILSPAIPDINYIYINSSASWVDFDNDGNLDILYSGPTSASGNVMMIYRNEGATFTRKLYIEYLTWQGNSFNCGDYDNDGDQDILLTSNIITRIYQNQGNFVFNEQYSVSLDGISESSSKFGDYDNDGDLDIILTGTLGGITTSAIFQNQGNNVFIRQTGISLTGVSGGSSEWGDYDNDGYPDLLITGNSSSSVFKNNGNNSFSFQSGIVLKGVSAGTGNWGDLDNDGDLDIIITGTNNGNNISKIYFNNGNNTFTESTTIVLDGINESSVDLADYDNDGDLDILLSGYKGPTRICRVYKNDSSVINPIPVAPTGLVSISAGNDLILKWNSVKSDNTPGKSLSYNVMVGTTSGGINVVSPNASAAGFSRISGMGNGQLDTTFVLKNIKKTTYYWKVQAIDNSFKGGPFSLQGTSTYSASYQAFGLKVPVIGAKESTLAWSRGNGTSCIVFMKQGNTGTALPVNNFTYNPSATFKSGTQIATTGWYCVYKGTLGSINITGLTANTDYIYRVFEYDGNPGSEIYNASSASDNPLPFKTGYFTELKSANLLPVTGNNLLYSQNSLSYWADIDNDNDLDLLLFGQSSTRLYRNDGPGTFVLLAVSLSTGYSASCGDYNNDGFIDIIIGDYYNTRLYKNNGNYTFTEQTTIVFPGAANGSLAWGDYDNDGDLDLVLTGLSPTDGAISKIFRNNSNNTFTEQNLISLTGVQGSVSKWGDYDNDGYLDLVISGYSNDATAITKIYRNNGNNNLIEQSKIALFGFSLGSVEWGDYDNDGDLDIMLSSSSFSKIYRNNGDNTFSEQFSISLPSALYGSSVWGDYDNDGDLDLLITGFTGTYSPITKVFKNNSNNTFTEDSACSLAGVGYCSAAWGDYDNDGDLDIILTGNTSTEAVSKIYRNDITNINIKPAAPTGTSFVVNKSDVTLRWNNVRSDNTPYKAMSYNIKAGTFTNGINVKSPHADVTGYRRLVTIGNCNLDTTYIFRNLPLGTYYWSIQAVDNGFAGSPFSAEGNFSVIPVQAKGLSAKILNNNSLSLKWERGNGDRCAVFCKQTATGLATPVNNTGYIADSEYGFGGQIGTSGWYCVYNGRADSVNITGLVYKKEYSFHVIEYLGTFGNEQFFTQISDGNPGVFSTSLFAEQTGITLPWAPKNKVAWGDYNNDGFLDLLIPGFPSKIYRNNGDNTFVEQSGIILTGVGDGSAAWGDYDNDGDLDIILTGSTVNYPPSTPVTKIYRNEGSNIFAEQTQISLTAVYYSSVNWGDYDNDGDLDILLTGATANDPIFNPVSKIYRNNGNSTFTEQSQIALANVYKGSAVWGDYDNDGDLDILINGALDYNFNSNRISKIYKNNGNNSFTDQTQIQLLPFSWSSSSWGDFDNDGDLDFLMTQQGQMAIYKNLGNGNFLNYKNVGLGYQGPCSAAWGDYDNDGYLDIILTNPGLDTKIFKNLNGASFNQQDDEALKNVGYGFVSWVDYDNDGDLDFLLAKDGKPTIIYKNNLIMRSGLFKPNTGPAAPSNLLAINSPLGVILKWNPVKTDETPFKTMTYNLRIGTKKDSTNICPPHTSASGYRKIATMGNAQTDTSFLLINLPSRKYYWSVQAVDQGLKGGVFSAVDSFDVKNILAFFSADTVCKGLNTTFTNQSTAFGDIIQNYLWNFGDGTTSTTASPTHLFSTSGVKNVTLITYSATTSDTLTKPILVKAKPILDFNASVACQGSETVLQNKSTYSGLTITSWSWDYGDGKGSTFQNPGSHGYLSAGNYQLTLIANADNGCSGSVIKTVTVGAIPVATITANTPLIFCSGDSVALSVPSNINYSYNWMLNGTSLTSGNSSRYVARSSGNYSVEVINSVGTCKTISSSVVINAQNAPVSPTISALGPTLFCQGDSVQLSVTNISGYLYQWKLNGGAVGSNSNQYTAKSTGTYNVVVSNTTGCIASSVNTINVVVNTLPTASTLNLSGPTTFCSGGNISLSLSPTPGYTYNWRNDNGPVSGANTSSLNVTTSGTYQLVITNGSGCIVKTTPVVVLVKPMPDKPIIVTDNYQAGKCLGETPVKLRAGNVASAINYQWSKNGIPVSNATSSFLEGFLTLGDYSLEAELGGCKSQSDILNVYFEDAPIKPVIYSKGPSVWYLACSNDSASKYKWYYNGGLIPGADKYLYVASHKLGKYNVSISNTKGCFTISDTLKIPTGVTGIEDIDPFRGMIIYPNPSSGLFTIEMDNNLFGEMIIRISDQNGREKLNIKFEKTTEHFSRQVDLSGQGKGMYLINLLIDKYLTNRKVIVK